MDKGRSQQLSLHWDCPPEERDAGNLGTEYTLVADEGMRPGQDKVTPQASTAGTLVYAPPLFSHSGLACWCLEDTDCPLSIPSAFLFLL